MTKIRIFSHWSEVGQMVQSRIEDTGTNRTPYTTAVDLTDDDLDLICMCIPSLRKVLSSGQHSVTVVAITLCRQRTRTYVDELLSVVRGYTHGNGEHRCPGYYMVNIEKHNGRTTAVSSYRRGSPTSVHVESHHMVSREYTVSDLIVRVKQKNNDRPVPGSTVVIGDC